MWNKLACWQGLRRATEALFRWYAKKRLQRLDDVDAVVQQERTLLRLVKRAAKTRFGEAHEFGRITSVREYQRRVPLRSYEDFWRGYWQEAFPRLAGITWPEQPRYFALSSGTSTGNTKYLPVTDALLASNRSAALCLFGALWKKYSEMPLLQGRMFFLGGSTDLTPVGKGIYAGDLSGIVAVETPRWLRPFSWPPTPLALIKNWDSKIQQLANASVRERITLLAGVPSWLMVLIDAVKRVAGAKTLAEIWPDLRVLVHGGVCFEPYRAWFSRELPTHTILAETYPSSEAFIAFEDARYHQLRLVVDHGIFFEFVPREELGRDRPPRHCLREVELGTDYAVVVTTCAGLWAYLLGDVVRFDSRNPPLIRFVGRTSYYLSAFGEHVTGEEIERAVSRAAQEHQAMVAEFHVGPVFADGAAPPGWHRYLIEWVQPPTDVDQFAHSLDRALRQLNADYDAHRFGDLGLGAPEILSLQRGAFANWLRSAGKLGGQHKVPRIDPTGQLTDSLLRFFTSTRAILHPAQSGPLEASLRLSAQA